jgi:bacterioferritin (cytochrome b1)
VRARLAPLFAGGPAHQGLDQALDVALRDAERAGGTLETDEILQSLLDCERIAHDFYLFQLDRLPDEHLVTLFRQLADEEASHIRAVEDAMRLLSAIHHDPPSVAAAPQA